MQETDSIIVVGGSDDASVEAAAAAGRATAAAGATALALVRASMLMAVPAVTISAHSGTELLDPATSMAS